MNDERKKTNAEVFTVGEAVNGLIDALKEAGYDNFNYDGRKIKYHLDVGLLVSIKSEGIPDFPVDTPWLLTASGFDWILYSMEEEDDGSKIHDIVFLLEGEI